ncbi:deoxyribose-phosphate aldolase [Rubrivivax benzoatilyticus]|uniref:Deoxyribose-phosphate aldolase n=1 Tax=Rubrivivax benzoatilyticus TaxID=316997 RepID=A0ABX0HUA3_9BURK|nr:deoxyribose-phosphate aldolase [Rubrivivax benzoatilyticus]EGJ09597.1 deoxyribose-phosphate aldolase [Rubrivivax benzoatilyticus JA2 = ATCC BAA-35]NHK98603.1 deoxyribose-phosphate aldolase [Rubrivivax benzoatilyticus]NHL24105.1 deoxyribose-phosphate aldolase [Rubrivivax benzoatilyticus]
MKDLIATSRTALACLDLTSLNDADTAADVERLCRRAEGPQGRVAAVCVWPRFVAQARTALPPAVKVAAVANFPDGSTDVERAVREAAEIVAAGGDEVDVVMPWQALDQARTLLAQVRRETRGRTLKVILETGELRDPLLIRNAARIALDAGADFLKTSTGRTPNGATIDAARLLLTAISSGGYRQVGLKVSGGIRTAEQAQNYVYLARAALGQPTPARFRIGASSLLDDLQAVIGGTARPGAAGSY